MYAIKVNIIEIEKIVKKDLNEDLKKEMVDIIDSHRQLDAMTAEDKKWKLLLSLILLFEDV